MEQIEYENLNKSSQISENGTQQLTKGTTCPQFKGGTKRSRYPQIMDWNTKLEQIKSMNERWYKEDKRR